MRREDVFISIYNSPTFLFFLLAASFVSSAVSWAFFVACFFDSLAYSFADSSASSPKIK